MAVGTTWFWNERFWFPSNVTWSDLRNSGGAQIEDVGAVIPITIVLLITRRIFISVVSLPIGRALGIPAANGRPPANNQILEKAFKSVSTSPHDKLLQGLAKQLDWSVRRVEIWFRRRRNQERPSKLTKFSQSSWLFVNFMGVWSYGMCTIPYESWFWETNSYWYNYPFHNMTVAIYNYYLIEASSSLAISMMSFIEERRKDFIASLIHHVATISLIWFSWVCNYTRVGCIVILLHSTSDIIIQVAKMANYAKSDQLATISFAIFALSWFVTRIILFPLWVLYDTIFVWWSLLGPFPVFHVYYLLNFLLLVLYSLHLYWFYTILYMAYIVVINGKVDKDVRSDVEDTADSSDETES